MKALFTKFDHAIIAYITTFVTLAVGSGQLSGLSIADWKSALLALVPAAFAALYKLVPTAKTVVAASVTQD